MAFRPLQSRFSFLFSFFLPGNVAVAAASCQISHQTSQYLTNILLKYSDGCTDRRSDIYRSIKISTGLWCHTKTHFRMNYEIHCIAGVCVDVFSKGKKRSVNPYKCLGREQRKYYNGRMGKEQWRVLEKDGTWEIEVLVRGDLGGGGEVCVGGKGSTLRNCQVLRKGWRGPEDELGKLFNCPLKQGPLTLLTTLPGPPSAR